MGVIGRITRTSDAALRPIEANLARFGLADGLFDVAAALRRAGAPYALTPGGLAASTMRTTGATTKRIDRLVAAGLAERRPDPADGRGVLVQLTDRGRERVDAAVAAHLAVEDGLLSALTERERTTLARLLAKLLLELEGAVDERLQVPRPTSTKAGRGGSGPHQADRSRGAPR